MPLAPGAEARRDYRSVCWIKLRHEPSSLQLFGCQRGCSGTGKGINDHLAGLGKKIDEEPG